MRRHEKAMTDRVQIDDVIRGSTVCRVAMSDGDQPYVVPLCFGYDGTAVYFHCALEGRKIEVLRRNPRVCLEFDLAGNLVRGDQACMWSIEYRSVIAFGTAELVHDPAGKRYALGLLMGQYADPAHQFSFPDDQVARTTVIKVVLNEISGKQSIKRQP